MSVFVAELMGTMFLIILGNGVVANVVLNQTKGNNSGWIVITAGWAMAVFVGVYIAAHGSDAHINPAVTLTMAAFNNFSWADVPIYIGGQMAGAMLGQLVVWLCYRDHYDATADGDAKLATFSTGPAIANPVNNFITEFIGTVALLLGVFFISKADGSLGALDALPVALLVFAIGLSLGGPTGYAINPARDLGPRIMHAILPLKDKGSSHWDYAWIPIAAPIAGGLAAGLIYKLLIQLKVEEVVSSL